MRLVKQILSEPLVHFVLTAFAIYFAVGVVNGGHSSRAQDHILISPARVEQLSNLYQQQFGQRPDQSTLDKLLESDIEEEILMREALKLNLDASDEVVRRRLAQKMRFLIEDLNAPPEPGDQELERYLQENARRYEVPATVSFHHVFFTDRGPMGDGFQRAQAVLDEHHSDGQIEPGMGDPFPDRYHYSDYSLEQVQRVMGQTPAAEELLKAPTGHWFGPVQSGYGWHLFYVDSRSVPRMPQLADIRGRLRIDFMRDAEEQLNEQALQRLVSHYQIVGMGEDG